MTVDQSYGLFIKKLKDFSLPLATVNEEHERRIVSAVVRKISLLNEHAFLRAYKVDRVDEKYSLRLIANSGNRPSSSDKEVIILDESNKKGGLSWCLDHGLDNTGLWIEGIKSAANIESLRNKFTQDELGAGYTDFLDNPDTVVSLPLKASNNSVIGVLSVQFHEEPRPSRKFVDILVEISIQISRIMRKANETASNIRNTTAAVEGFLEDIVDIDLSPDALEERVPIGFIARPFNEEFNEIGAVIENFLSGQGIQVRTFDPDQGGGLNAESLIEDIRGSLFGVADITGSNPNVLMEVGLMIASNKDILILKGTEDKNPIPFNVSGRQAHEYRVTSGENLELKPPQENKFYPANEILSNFISRFRSKS